MENVIAAVIFGALIGLSLGALGGGGAVLTVPALVYVLGQSAHRAVAESLVIVGITSLMAVVGHARAHRVRWRAGTLFGAAGIPATFVGTALGKLVNANLLLLAFALLLLVAATAMWVRNGRREATPQRVRGNDERNGRWRPRDYALVVLSALVVGFLAGFFGVGGGFVIVPALVLVLGVEMPEAVGTSLMVITINCAVSLIQHLGHAEIDWSVVAPFAVAAVVGASGGKRLADWASELWLTRAFVMLLVGVAIYVAIRSGTALA